MRLIKILAILILLTGCGAQDKNPEPATSREYISDLGHIRIDKDGVKKNEEESTAVVTVDMFFDPACGYCALFEHESSEVLNKYIEDGVVEVIYHPVAFLNDRTPDDYSNRAVAYILAAAEYVPDKALSYLREILNQDFMPTNPGVDLTPDSKFIAVMEKLGFTEEEIDKIEENKEGFVVYALAATMDFTREDSNWKDLSSFEDENGPYIYTPFVVINKAGELTEKSLDLSIDSIEKDLTEVIENLK